jgi:hypothetical protein
LAAPDSLKDKAVSSFFKYLKCPEVSSHQLVDPGRLGVEEVGNPPLLVEINERDPEVTDLATAC